MHQWTQAELYCLMLFLCLLTFVLVNDVTYRLEVLKGKKDDSVLPPKQIRAYHYVCGTQFFEQMHTMIRILMSTSVHLYVNISDKFKTSVNSV